MSATTTTSRTTQTVLNVRDAVDRASSHVTLSGGGLPNPHDGRPRPEDYVARSQEMLPPTYRS